MKRMMIFGALWAALGATASAQTGPTISGSVRVMDGDMIVVADTHPPIRLWGIDAPELSQACFIGEESYDCHAVAVRALETITYEQTVTCERRTDPDRRRRGKVYGVCKAGDQDLAEELVRAGMAVAFREQTDDYVEAEEAAKAAGVGLWRGEFQMPWVWVQENLWGG